MPSKSFLGFGKQIAIASKNEVQRQCSYISLYRIRFACILCYTICPISRTYRNCGVTVAIAIVHLFRAKPGSCGISGERGKGNRSNRPTRTCRSRAVTTRPSAATGRPPCSPSRLSILSWLNSVEANCNGSSKRRLLPLYAFSFPIGLRTWSCAVPRSE